MSDDPEPGGSDGLLKQRRPEIVERLSGGKTVNARGVWILGMGFAIMSLSALGCVLVRALCLGRGENLCRLYVVAPCARLFFRLAGLTVDWPELLAEPAIYLFNHTSTYDIFLITGLGHPNLRYFLSWPKTRRIIPVTVVSLLQGTYYTPWQSDRPARVRCFERAEASLRKTGYSTILSPEGVRTCDGEVGHFNKGAFHMATHLGLPIVPLYFYIPHDINPWVTTLGRTGHITIDRLPTVDTSGWSLERLTEQIAEVRAMYVAHHAARHAQDAWY